MVPSISKPTSLTINDQKKIAIYKGNVVAVQGDNTLRTIELEVQYVSNDDGQKDAKGQKIAGAKPAKAAAAPGEDSQQIKRIKAKQKVVMVSTPAGKDEQSATSDFADYDVATQMVELIGNVYIKQGKNVITGSKVTMNLKTSEYTVDGVATARLWLAGARRIWQGPRRYGSVSESQGRRQNTGGRDCDGTGQGRCRQSLLRPQDQSSNQRPRRGRRLLPSNDVISLVIHLAANICHGIAASACQTLPRATPKRYETTVAQ